MFETAKLYRENIVLGIISKIRHIHLLHVANQNIKLKEKLFRIYNQKLVRIFISRTEPL